MIELRNVSKTFAAPVLRDVSLTIRRGERSSSAFPDDSGGRRQIVVAPEISGTFADSPLAHNAAHDVRHVTVKPCH